MINQFLGNNSWTFGKWEWREQGCVITFKKKKQQQQIMRSGKKRHAIIKYSNFNYIMNIYWCGGGKRWEGDGSASN